MRFGKKIRELRKVKNLSLRALAEAVGVSFTYISKIENNLVSPSSGLLSRIAARYGLDPAALKSFKPYRTNLYSELGSTFAATVTSRPVECAHVLGTLIRDLGADYVMWGTDSLLWGNPQWQIDAFRRFQIPDELVDGHGYPHLTDEVKQKILGGNAARLWELKTAMNEQGREVPRVEFG